VSTKKILVTKVVGNGKMYITAKNGVKIQNFAIELAQTKPFFVMSFSVKPSYEMFGIFPRY
jgi:hypothetical protein